MIRSHHLTNILYTFICLLPIFLLILLSLKQDYSIFVYTLDDPYIHLELAKNILNGNYGINEHEFSSPSSSILWPLILAPLSVFYWYIYAPLILNTIFLGLTLKIFIDYLFKDIKYISVRVIMVIAIALSLNLYGLVLTGMEHNLQVLCSAVIVIGLFDKQYRHTHPWVFYLALVVAPLVRYESLAITVPIILYLITLRQDRFAAILSGITLIILIGSFSLFLFSQSGYFFPSSVMIKQAAVSNLGITSLIYKVLYNVHIQGSEYGWLIAIFIFTMFVSRTEIKLSLTCVAISLLYLALGKYGWFGRYEVFFVLFAIIAIYLIAKEKFKTNMPNLIICIILIPLCFVSLISSTLLTPLASSNIYNQQYLISQFVKYLDEPVAVNDLGLISFYSDKIVIDLWGLGSIRAMEDRKTNNRNYIKNLMTENDTQFAIIYRERFAEKELEKMVLVAELILNETRITPENSTVTFFANSDVSAEILRKKLRQFDFKDNILKITGHPQ